MLTLLLSVLALPARADGGRDPVMPPVLVPTDVTNPAETGLGEAGIKPGRDSPAYVPSSRQAPLTGIFQVNGNKFGELAPHSSTAGIAVKAGRGAHFSRPNAYCVQLDAGELVVHVQHPSKVALISSDLADISLQSEQAALVRLDKSTLRIINLLGKVNHLQIKVKNGSAFQVLTIDCSYELVVGANKLTVADLHPPDGIGRRNLHLLRSNLAVGEVSLNSVLGASDILLDFARQPANTADKRLLSDMAKMAAVISAVGRHGGFAICPKEQNR